MCQLSLSVLRRLLTDLSVSTQAKAPGDVNIGYWQKTASHLPDFIDANSLIRAAMLPLQPLE